MAEAASPDPLVHVVEDNAVLAELVGPYGRNITEIERALEVRIAQRGNRLAIGGEGEAAGAALATLRKLESRVRRGRGVESADVRAAIRNAQGRGAKGGSGNGKGPELRTRKRVIEPRSPTQRTYLEALTGVPLTFGTGPAGTGKTYLAVAAAVSAWLGKEVDRIILSRPAVEAGERLGFLPGDLKEKIDPYLRPLYDALHDMLPGETIAKAMENGTFEVAPLAFMRGRTLANCYVVLDEAQNCTRAQMKMFLTRLGDNAQMAVTGDPSQVDLPRGEVSGLAEAVALLDGVEGVSCVRFGAEDVVRHPLVARIVEAYDRAAATG